MGLIRTGAAINDYNDRSKFNGDLAGDNLLTIDLQCKFTEKSLAGARRRVGPIDIDLVDTRRDHFATDVYDSRDSAADWLVT